MTNIKASEVLKELKDYIEDLPHYSPDEVAEALDMANKALEQQPSERLKGKWITWKEAGNYIPSETRFECSVCHDAAQTLCNGLDLLSPYCPNCGSHNGGEENEQNSACD